MIAIFALSNGRSGTRFLCHLCRHNLKDAVCRHEPYFDWGNPAMFGSLIYDHLLGRYDRIRRLVEKKQRWIQGRRCRVYVETSHAFLKTWYDVALEYFPALRLVHLIRNPLSTARSETNRELTLNRFRVPLRRFRGEDGGAYFNWALTGKEPIYESFHRHQLSMFQKYAIQWIEIENRAVRLLDQHGLHDRCFTLHSPRDLNDPARVRAMFDFFGLETRSAETVIAGSKNRTPGARTLVTSQESREFREVIQRMPAEHLEIFRRPPYADRDWAELLRK